ncbi:hypothetical protein OUZ56_004081 [Daphnia magna]|uniref:Uncharacterized protein n=1 Tax=Daphnia magna TaxID=35525 RepID=A0ABQ9YNQ1_9CRUS|nr:hypothetical protein OUZ56_004081 [Daphnia magna]
MKDVYVLFSIYVEIHPTRARHPADIVSIRLNMPDSTNASTFLLLILPILGTHPNAVRVTAHALWKHQLPQLSPAYNP